MNLPRVPILELDPDLAEAVGEADRALATRYAAVPLLTAPLGDWDARAALEPAEGTLGILVIEGLVTRSLDIGGRVTAELLGEGDVLQPWNDGFVPDSVDVGWSWTVLEPLRVAVLDARFGQVAGRWPALVEVLMARALRRSRALAFQLSLTQVKRVEERLNLLLWFLSERWGKVSPDGVLIPLRLTHGTLALLAGARRPTVTTALGELARCGRISRHPQGWLLHAAPTKLSDD